MQIENRNKVHKANNDIIAMRCCCSFTHVRIRAYIAYCNNVNGSTAAIVLSASAFTLGQTVKRRLKKEKKIFYNPSLRAAA